jgi:hypothetical protein
VTTYRRCDCETERDRRDEEIDSCAKCMAYVDREYWERRPVSYADLRPIHAILHQPPANETSDDGWQVQNTEPHARGASPAVEWRRP